MNFKKNIILVLKKNASIYFAIEILRAIKKSSFFKITGQKKKYPKVIQLPITYKCNSKCLMCNIWNMNSSSEVSIEEFAKFMKDDIFRKVEAVGINGGEPSLISNLSKYVDEILKLPKLKSLNIISNGFKKNLLLELLKTIYQKCLNKNIRFHVSISLDGVGEVHNTVRGIPNIFKTTISTIDQIIANQHKYCDTYTLGCTVIKQNVHNLLELEAYRKIKNYNLRYRLGIENKRIESDKLKDNYSVINHKSKQNAKEFFHYMTSQAKTFQDKMKYFSIFHWLNNEYPKRLLGCFWKDNAITLDSKGEIYYCAVASKSIGNLKNNNGKDIFFNKENIKYRKSIIKNNCNNCIHDYTGRLEIKNIFLFLKTIIKNKIAMKIYRIKARLKLL